MRIPYHYFSDLAVINGYTVVKKNNTAVLDYFTGDPFRRYRNTFPHYFDIFE